MAHGVFIAIEGIDGSGKKTQTELLRSHLELVGKEVFTISFPRYGKHSTKIIEKYLRGEFSSALALPPELISLAYAIDRFSAADTIREKIARGSVVIADRYVASNLAHQGGKVINIEERQKFYDDVIELEYGTLGIPKPDLNIVLLVPSNLAQTNIDQKDRRSYTDKKRDIHEADANHLEHAKASFEELCKLYPSEFTAIECMETTSQMRTPAQIHEDIWNQITPLFD